MPQDDRLRWLDDCLAKYYKSKHADYDNSVGAGNFVGFVAKHCATPKGGDGCEGCDYDVAPPADRCWKCNRLPEAHRDDHYTPSVESRGGDVKYYQEPSKFCPPHPPRDIPKEGENGP